MRRISWLTTGLLLALAATPTLARQPATFVYPALDEVVAQVPAGQAATAAIAQGLVHRALYHARQQAVRVLCGSHAPPPGPLLHRDGPYRLQTADGRGEVWMYRLARQPQGRICNTGKATFLRTLSTYLPEWISIRGAERKVAWRQGKAVTGSLAAGLMVRR